MSVTYVDNRKRRLYWPVPTWAWRCHDCGAHGSESTAGAARRAATDHVCAALAKEAEDA